jgi:hypothetical protein
MTEDEARRGVRSVWPRDRPPADCDAFCLPSTLAAIKSLDLQLCDCDGVVARGVVTRAIAHLDTSLLLHLTGPHPPLTPARRRRTSWRPYAVHAPRPGTPA